MKRLTSILASAIAASLCIFAAASCGNSSSKGAKAGAMDPADVPDTAFAIADLSVVQLNVAPDYDAESATQIVMGMDCKFLERGDGWTKVLTPEGYVGWCPTTGITILNASEYGAWLAKPKYIVTSYFTILRKDPSDASECVSDAVMGGLVLQGDASLDTPEFYSVSTNGGKAAFVRRSDAVDYAQWLDTRMDTPENIAATGKMFLGFPYVWGGTSAKGMDCSGFTKTVYFMNGVILQRDASQQVKTGKPVDISKGIDSLQVGDLVFFGTEAKDGKPERISHVSLYIGGGEIIHSSGRVRYSNLMKDAPDYYDRKPLRAVRIIGNEDQGLGIVTLKQNLADKKAKFSE
jgi:cell wall-associated NlpC family hydrolase